MTYPVYARICDGSVDQNQKIAVRILARITSRTRPIEDYLNSWFAFQDGVFDLP